MAEAMTSLLARFGVDYKNAPEPTPALLAFMRGLGVTMDSAEDAKRTNQLRMKERATQAQESVTRGDERTKARMTGDLMSRGVLSSGETNTRVARQAEDVAQRRGEIEQTLAEGIDTTEQGFMNTRDALRQQALERTLSVETQTAQEKAAAAAQEANWTRQQEAADLAFKRQQEASDAAFRKQEELYKKYQGLT